MSSIRTKGRMLNKDISNSHKFANLSPQAAVLFCMIIPHLNSHGKLNGGVGFIKDEICPLISYLTSSNIQKYLKEINDYTSVKWFEYDGRYWIHSVNFLTEHQTLDSKKLGRDLLPTYSRVNPELVESSSRPNPELVHPEVEVEVEEVSSSSNDKVKVEEEFILTKKKRKLEGKRLDVFLLFWDAFDYKVGKAEAADAWLDIPTLTKADVDKILKSATTEATKRPGLITAGKTPKMPQGWISGRRWEDDLLSSSMGYNPMAGVK